MRALLKKKQKQKKQKGVLLKSPKASTFSTWKIIQHVNVAEQQTRLQTGKCFGKYYL